VSPRLARADRLVEYRKLRTSEAEAKLAAATRATQGARDNLALAERAWERALVAADALVTADELASRDAYLVTLRRRVDVVGQQVAAAERNEENTRGDLRAAKTEQRKLETWRDGLASELRKVEAKAERVASDAIAAGRPRRTG
jgi:flagellar export protein FliJ